MVLLLRMYLGCRLGHRLPWRDGCPLIVIDDYDWAGLGTQGSSSGTRCILEVLWDCSLSRGLTLMLGVSCLGLNRWRRNTREFRVVAPTTQRRKNVFHLLLEGVVATDISQGILGPYRRLSRPRKMNRNQFFCHWKYHSVLNRLLLRSLVIRNERNLLTLACLPCGISLNRIFD